MRRWIWALTKRFVTFFVGTVAFVQALSYILGSDEDVKAFALEHRSETAIILALGALVFAMYDWMERSEP